MAGIFKAYDIRGIYGDNLTEDLAYQIGLSSANTVYETGQTILVSKDARPHSNSLSDSLIQGLIKGGCNVIDIGLAATPMNYWANTKYKADGSIMVTASHNPGKYNGFKLSLANAAPIAYADGIELIEQNINTSNESVSPGSLTTLTSDESQALLSEYLDFMRKFLEISDNPRKLKIAIDAANGMAGYFIEQFLEKYEFLDVVPLYWDIDCTFPNHEADPLKLENLKDLQKSVIDNSCDFGISFDGDADRAVFIDNHGQVITSDLTTGLIGVDYLSSEPGLSIGYDLRSSQIVPESINSHKGTAIKTKVGHSNIKKLMRENNIQFAGELSGHFYFKELSYTDSALMAFIKVLNILQKDSQDIASIMQSYRQYHSSGEINYTVTDTAQVLHTVEEHFRMSQDNLEISHLDGLSVHADNWWLNLRASNTEPLLRLNLEAKTAELKELKLQETISLITS